MELKPCPFCGKEPWGTFGPNEHGEWWIECNECFGDWHFDPDTTDRKKAKDIIEKAWNTRAENDRIKDLEEVIRCLKEKECTSVTCEAFDKLKQAEEAALAILISDIETAKDLAQDYFNNKEE